MDIKEHFKSNKNWWYKVLLFSFIISSIFPVTMNKDESSTFNVLSNSLGTIFGGLILFVLAYVFSKLLNKRLNEKQIKITLLICFSFWWIILILIHFNINITLK